MERRIGAHVVHVEDDLLFLTVHGDFTLADIIAFTEIGDALMARFGYLLVLNDLTDARNLPSDARKYSAERMREARRKGPVYAVSALFGAGPLTRGLATLYYSAMRLIAGVDRLSFFCANQTEARAVLAERRRYFHAKLNLTP